MSVPRRTLPVLLAAGLVPVSLALALPASPPPPKTPPPTALRVARLLDSIAQSRFQDTNMHVFGMSRIALPPHSLRGRHVAFTFTARNKAEAETLRSVEAGRRDYLVDFLHCAPVPAVPAYFRSEISDPPPAGSLGGADPLLPATDAPRDSLTPLFLHSQSRGSADPPSVDGLQMSLRLEAAQALPGLRAGREAQYRVNGWSVLLRPVVAAQASCLSCHTTAKKNDTLGVMVYAVRDSLNKP